MIHIGQMSRWVQYVARHFAIVDMINYADEVGWSVKDGLRHVSLTGSPVLSAIGAEWFAPEVATLGLERVDASISRHRRTRDVASVVLGITDEEDNESWSDVTDQWELLYDRQVLVIPAGSVHGIRLDPSHRPFYLLTATTPSGDVDDTQFV